MGVGGRSFRCLSSRSEPPENFAHCLHSATCLAEPAGSVDRLRRDPHEGSGRVERVSDRPIALISRSIIGVTG